MADRKKALSYMEQAIGVLEDHSSDCDPEVLSSLDGEVERLMARPF